MSAELAGARVLARIDSSRFYERPGPYREEVRAWLRANGVDPNEVICGRDVEVVLLDAPAIVREEWARGEDGRRWADRHVVHSLCRVPLPAHLADPA